MLIIDTALAKAAEAGKPVRVGLIGAGAMARGVTNQILNSTPGMELVAISNRTLANAAKAYKLAGAEPQTVKTVGELETAIRKSQPAITDDPNLLCQAEGIDVLIEATGAVEFGAHVTLEALRNGKHMILMNAELDGTTGPILQTYADRAGVILTGCDGDQPGVEMNLHRFVKGIGLTPLLCGNIKGLQDPYRNPTTQKGFAEKWNQSPHMVTSFADGTKVSFEQALVANATGMTVAKQGMYGFDYRGHVDDATELFDIDELKRLGGIVDYVVGAKPGPGVFVYATHDDPAQKHFLNLYKLGEGPLYSFYTPYHLCHFEVPTTAARVALFGDATIRPLGAPQVEVVALAKRDLKAGEIVDGLGGYMTYGECETASTTLEKRLLPIGVAEGCKLLRDVNQDSVLTYDDVELPKGRLIDQLRLEQSERFPTELQPV